MMLLKSAPEIALKFAGRVRERRLRRNWTQRELARRAGVRPATYRVFEKTGRIALIRLLKVMQVLGIAEEFDSIARSDDLTGLTTDDLSRMKRRRARARTGRTPDRR